MPTPKRIRSEKKLRISELSFCVHTEYIRKEMYCLVISSLADQKIVSKKMFKENNRKEG